MATTYYTLLTNIGQAKIANAIALGQLVQWTQMAVGDGNGNPTTPNQSQTALVREVYRASINQLTVDAENPNYMVAEMIIPTTVGGWAVNEVGIFDADGDLIAVSNFPATYKPQLTEGSGRDLVVRIIIQVSNASVVTLKVDPAVILASQAWVAANYVKKITVAGGTTGQVLAKNSNANEDFKWVDPSAAVSVNVNALREIQTLAAAQTVVTLVQRTTTGLAVYVEGARLLEGIDWTANSTTQLTLAQAYPAGSRIHVYQNDPFSTLADPTEAQRGLPLVADNATADAGTDDAKMMTAKKVLRLIRASAASATETLRGVLRIGTQAEVDAGTADDVIVTPKKLRSGVTSSFGAIGYIFLPTWMGGYGIQWGFVDSGPGAGVAQTITFPTAFPVACYGIVSNFKYASDIGSFGGAYFTVNQLLNSSARYISTMGRYWLAWGK